MLKIANFLFCFSHPVLVLSFIFRMGHFPNVLMPRSLAEKYLWRKIFDRNPEFVKLSDKIGFKEHFSEKLPDINLARIIWRGKNLDEAVDASLQYSGYLKANHSSGANLKLTGQNIDRKEKRALLQRWLLQKYHQRNGEWAYKDIVPELFIEEDISVASAGPMVDLNLYVFGDCVPGFHVILNNKRSGMQAGIFDRKGRNLEARFIKAAFQVLPPRYQLNAQSKSLPEGFSLPVDIDLLCDLAVKVARGHDHLRVDFMWNGQQLYLCETTVYSIGGYPRYAGTEILDVMSECWDLRKSWFLTAPQAGWRKSYAGWLKSRLGSGLR